MVLFSLSTLGQWLHQEEVFFEAKKHLLDNAIDNNLILGSLPSSILLFIKELVHGTLLLQSKHTLWSENLI